jgi:hypothetical protein
MKNLKRKIKKGAKRMMVSFLLITTVMWSFGPALMMLVPVAKAATAISISFNGLPTDMPGSPISASSVDMPVLRISATASQAAQTLTSVTATFSGTGFTNTDLKSLATDATSGVALYADTNGNSFYDPGTDLVITSDLPIWSTNTVTLTPATPPSLTNGTAKNFFLVIKTSGAISNNDEIIATIAANGVVTSDGNGPIAGVSSNYMKADTAAVSIAEVRGASGSNTLTVRFSKPVKKFGAGFDPLILADTPFTFVDNGTVTGTTIAAISHFAGQDFATVTLSDNLDSGDLDGTPSTLAAGNNKIVDMGGVAVGTDTVAVSNPLDITTFSIPSTVVAADHSVTPLITFAAAGGTIPYTWEAATAGDGAILTNLGLTLAASGPNAGKLTGTILDVPGSYSINIKATDSAGTPATITRMYNINVAPSGGGGIPGITSVVPGGGPTGAVSMPVTITGTNTNFSASSRVQFMLSGSEDTNICAAGGCVPASATATSISLSVNIDAGTTAQPHDVKVVTGTEQAIMPNGFGIFASGGSGLGLLMPSDAATSVQMPPNFSFDPSANGTINSYRIAVNTTSNFAGTTLWDYVFPKPADVNNTNNSHCDTFGCNTGYGEGRFMILAPPAPLAPNMTYYWRVRTYAEPPSSAISSATAVESTAVRSFTTTNSMSDVQPPNIMHRQIFQATASTDLNVVARVMDNLANSTTTPALSSSLFYCAGAACSPTTEVVGTLLGAGYYKYIIPSATISTVGTIVRYYISASDGTNTQNFKQPDGATPFQLASVAAGTANSITGNIKDNLSANIQNAYVFAEGTGFLSALTGADGNFTLGSNNLFAGNYDLVAFKSGYGDPMIGGIPAGSTGIQFILGQGFEGGFGGDTSKPMVKFTGPMDGMNGIPGNDTNFKIFVVFNKEMSQSKFSESGNMLVKKVTDFSGDTPTTANVAGSWVYYNSNPNLAMVPPESYMAVFSPSEVFGENQTIIVSVTSSITDTAGNSVQSNMPDGSYSFMFMTGSNVAFTGGNIVGGTFGSGAFMPPHVKGTMPPPGAMNVPTNSKMVINFSDPMADDGGGYVLKNFVKLFTVSSGVETDISSSALDTVVLDGNKLNATINLKSAYNSGLFAASASYRLKVLGGAKAANGMTIAPPGQETNQMFMSDFKTGATSDSVAPTVTGSYPNTNDTNVPVNLTAINVAFSKDMNASTISTSTFYLSIGSTAVNGTVEYRGIERQAFFVPKTALNPNTIYTINVTTGATGLNGQAFASAVARNFTTGAADAIAPEIMFMNADDYGIAVTFSEPMNAAKATDTLNWPTSVINPAAYNIIKYGSAGFDPEGAGTAVSLTNATFKYDAGSSTALIEGLDIASAIGQELYLSMDITGAPASGAKIAKDLSGNSITSDGNSARSPIQNSATTMGALGPMAMGTSAFNMGGGFMPSNFSASTFGFAPPVDVMPFNMMAGKSTIYGIRLPVSQQIPSGGSITLTFPTGFDVSGAKQDVNSPMRTDLNGPGTGSLTFKCLTNVAGGKSCAGGANANDTGAAQGELADDGVVVNTSARTVTVYLSGATNVEGHDFLQIDIDGIVNSTVPKGFETSGYTVDVKTKNGTAVVESLTSMPFFIQEAGSYTLSGTITAAGNDQAGTMEVYLDSPMTGPMKATTTDFATTTTATYSFTNLMAGDYMIYTDQTITLGSKEFNGKAMPEFKRITGTDTYDFTLSDNTIGSAVTVSIDGPNGELLDIFAGSPTGFKVKQVMLDGSAGAENFTINLANGKWFIGVGPQMPKGPMAGPPPAPIYLPPKPIEVGISSGPAYAENSGDVNDGTIIFTLTSATKAIRGLVKDGAGKVIANAEVYGYSPDGGFGTHAQADSTGAFTLNVVDGSYVVGGFIPGMPSSKEVPVTVTSHATTYLLIGGATTAITPAAAATSFILKLAKPDYTISGKVTDGTNVVQGASVYAYRTDGPGNANANTNSSGQYTLYVSAGTWNVGSFLPQYGQLSEVQVIVSASTGNITNQNFSPTGTGTFYTVSGTVTSGGSNVQGAFVKISGNGTANETKTAVDGTYSFKVPSGNGYVVRAFIPGVGETAPLAAFNVSGNITGKDIAVGTSRTITFTFSESVTEAFVDLFSSTGVGNHIKINNSTTGTLSLPDGNYKVRVDIPGTAIGMSDIAGTDVNTVYSSTTGIVTVDGNEGLTITLPTLRTITGAVTDGTNNVANAWVEIVDPANGIHFGTMTTLAASGTNFSFKAAEGTYFINAMKPGYFREPSQIVIDDATAAQTLTLSTAEKTISGQILIGATGAANAFVRAEKQGGGFAGTQADATGNYTLYVNSGVWRIYGVAEGYAEAAYASNPIDMTTASTATGKNITLSTAVNLNAPKSKPITPSSGGTLEDATAGVKLTIPANALGSSTSAGNIQAKETNNIRETSSAKPLMKYDSTNGSYVKAAKEITATDSSGNPITNLSSDVTVEMTYTKAELANTASASDSSINTKDEADDLKMAYWDETTSNWVTKPTTVTFKNSDGDVITDATTIDTAEEFNTNVATVLISANTDHFSLYAPIVSTDPSAPSTPSGFAASASSSSQIDLSWTQTSGATSYDIYRSASSGGTFTRVSESDPTVSSGSTVTYSDTGLTASTSYYYKITSLNTSGESSASSEVTATTSAAAQASSGGGGSPVSSTPTSTAGQVAATPSLGGTVSKTNSDGSKASISLPANALTSNATITITPAAKVSVSATRPVSSGNVIVGSYIYNFTAVNANNAEVNTFAKSLTITLTYTDAQIAGLAEGTLKIYYWSDTSSEWVVLADSAVNAVTNTVTATTTHFTYFAILGSQASEETPATPETPSAPSSDIIDGDIIQCKTCSDPFAVYIVKAIGNTKYIRHIVSIEIFNYYGHLKWENLKQVSSLNDYSLSGWVRVNTGANGTAGSSDKVYEINGDQTKHWINMTAEQFLSHGGSEPAIYTVNQGELNLYAKGPDVMSL